VSVSLDLPLTNPVLVMATAVVAFLVAPFLSRRIGAPSLVVLIVLGAAVGPAGLGLLGRSGVI
jgi:NhaP-type Na+/H+ and K+/H+ antiporter